MSIHWLHFGLLMFSSYVTAEIVAIDSQNYTETFLDNELKLTKEIMGVIVLADPPDACTNITVPPLNLRNSSLHCFVLIEGSLCSLDEKVKNAWLANYSAALIYNIGEKIKPIWENKLIMLRLFSAYNITAVVINTIAAERIMDSYLYTVDPGSRLFILMNHPNFISFLVVFAFVGGIFLLLVLLFMMIKCIQRSRQRRRYRLSPRHLKRLMTIKYKSGDPYDTCAICLEDYKEKDRLRVLPCAHAYHCKCIDPWLTDSRRTCPVCKQRVRLAGVHDDEDDSESDTEGRAESAPLIRHARRQVDHGTFTDNVPVSVQSTSRILGLDSGETTSKDVPSDALDGSSVGSEFSSLRPSTSAPNVLMAGYFPMPKDESKESLITHVDVDRIDDDSRSSSSSGDGSTRDKTYVV